MAYQAMGGDVLTGEVRLSFVHLLQAYAPEGGQDKKYSVTVLVPKTDTQTVADIQRAIEYAKKQGLEKKWNGVMPAVVNIPVYDGDGVRPNGEAFGEECKGHYVFTASVAEDKGAPEVVDMNGAPIRNATQIYSGMYARVFVTFFPYAAVGKKGIGCGLGPVQKTRDGEALSGHTPSAASVFGAPAGSAANVFGGAPAAQPQPAYPQGQGSMNTPQGMPAAAPSVAAQGGFMPLPTAEVDPITGLPLDDGLPFPGV